MRAGRSRFRRRLVAVTLLAAAVRLSYVLLAKQDLDTCGQDLCGDAIWYSAQASALASGDPFEDLSVPGTPAADHPPLTPVLLGPSSAVSDDDVMAQRLTLALVGTAGVALVMLLAREVAGDEVATIAGVLAAVYPNLWLNDGVVMAESIAATATAGVLLLVYRYVREPSPRAALVLGAAAGMATLARAELALLVPLALLPIALRASGRAAGGVRHVVLVGVTAALVLAPWVVWNTTRFDNPVLISSNDGLTLLGANCDKTYLEGSRGIWVLPAAEDFGDPSCAPEVGKPTGDQSQVTRHYRSAGLRYALEHWADQPAVQLARQGRVWSLFETHQMWWYNQGEGRERIWSRYGEWAFRALVPLAALGALRLRRDGRAVLPLLATFVVTAVTASLFYGIIRFRIPVEVALVVLAASGIAELADRVRRASAAPADLPEAVAAR